jgi:hypothetical protein
MNTSQFYMLNLELANKETGENIFHLLQYMTFPIFKIKFMENCTIVVVSNQWVSSAVFVSVQL